MASFTAAAQWLQNATGSSNPDAGIDDHIVEHEQILRNAQETSDLDARRRQNDLSTEKTSVPPAKEVKGKGGVWNNQPKPKFVAHKPTTKGQSKKAAKTSNRLGGDHLA